MNQSQKDQGNTCFKNQNYSQAITHYKSYVSKDHQDNKNVYLYLSLCYSKLNNSQESVNAAQQAVEIDKSFTKGYYRLAQEYKKLPGKEYEVFINAVKFHKIADQDLLSQKEEMHNLAANYRQLLAKKQPPKATQSDALLKKTQTLDSIIKQSQNLVDQKDLRGAVNKHLQEWLIKWDQNIQDEETKWLEIENIIEELDYDLGLNLAFFYINKIKISETKNRLLEKLNELRKRLKKEKTLNFQELEIQTKQLSQPQKLDDQNLFEEQLSSENLPSLKEKIKSKEKTNKVPKTQPAPQSLVNINESQPSPKKKTKQIIESMPQQNKQKHEQAVQSKLTNQKENHGGENTASQEPNEAQNKVPNSNPFSYIVAQTSKEDFPQPKQLNYQQLQTLYQQLCGDIPKSKDVYTASYQSVFSILQSTTITTSAKGWLLVQLRKRIKKFKLIMKSASQNQQKLAFNLLKVNNLEQYVVDVAPMYFKQ